MAESAEHINYVIMISNYVKELLPVNEHPFIMTDSPNEVAGTPPVAGNYRPDVYYQNNGLLIIGEAKTDPDFDRQHSINQYKSYFEECDYFAGMAMLVVGGSWRISAALANMLRNIKRQYGYRAKAIVINNLGQYREI